MKEILKYLRQLHSFSQTEISEKLGISRQSYIKYEKGTVIPNAETVKSLAKIYNVSTTFIQKNKIPGLESAHKSRRYSIQEQEVQAAQPQVQYAALPRKPFEGIFDGRSIQILHKPTSITLKKGQHIRFYIEDDEAERRRKACATILSFKGSLPVDFDYKKELQEALDEKYGLN